MSKHLSGKDFDIMVGGLLVHVLSASLKITDNRKVKYVKGVPVGHFDGDVENMEGFEHAWDREERHDQKS